ncbi:hypothetical protein N9B69_01390 [Amylibacter sp.]|jgi:dienelactone hydrolase|nr:hypothetical protein [Amylibacter sp.]
MRSIPITITLGFLLLIGCTLSETSPKTSNRSDVTYEYMTLNVMNNGKPAIISAELVLPSNASGPLPLIITQHGSSRDGTSFKMGKGRTDEMSRRIRQQAPKRGFAVVSLDAFYNTGIKPGDKRKFPNAAQYATQLKTFLQSDPRIDQSRIFYIGFSYGGSNVLKSYGSDYEFQGAQWRATASLEPGCNVVLDPQKRNYATIIFKGTKSHYYPQACQWYAKKLRDAGNQIELVLVEGANHFFSTNGHIVNGKAVNGCSDNPVIRYSNGTLRHVDGTSTNRDQVIKDCITKQGGAGLNRIHLNWVIDRALSFFESKL